jgi:hypothetical protein
MHGRDVPSIAAGQRLGLYFQALNVPSAVEEVVPRLASIADHLETLDEREAADLHELGLIQVMEERLALVARQALSLLVEVGAEQLGQPIVDHARRREAVDGVEVEVTSNSQRSNDSSRRSRSIGKPLTPNGSTKANVGARLAFCSSR